MTIQRYALSDKKLTFIAELNRDVTFSFIAHALVCGPSTRTEAHIFGNQPKPHPLVMQKDNIEHTFRFFRNGLLRWISSSRAIIPADPWLYSLLQTDSCLIFGEFTLGIRPRESLHDVFTPLQPIENQAILSWSGNFKVKDKVELINGLQWLGEYFQDLTKNGLRVLAQNIMDVQILVSSQLESGLSDDLVLQEAFDMSSNWREILPKKAQREYFLLQTENIIEPHTFEYLIETMELYNKEKNADDVLYVAAIKSEPGNPPPETLLAKIWNECLGPQPIPFDPEARSKLIEHGRQHPELKRHIEAWEEMKRTGSKWVVGSVDD